MGMTENQIINAALTEARTDLTKSRHQREAMAIAQQRGELISKELVTRQARYILLCLRQAILNFPTRYARHVVGIADEHGAPSRSSPRQPMSSWANWRTFPRRPSIPIGWQPSKPMVKARRMASPLAHQEIRAEQQKAERRRKQKTATMRKLRAKG
jgi:hypothetical protein